MTFELHIRSDNGLQKFRFGCKKMDTAKLHAEAKMAELNGQSASLFNEGRHTTKTFENGKWNR